MECSYTSLMAVKLRPYIFFLLGVKEELGEVISQDMTLFQLIEDMALHRKISRLRWIEA